MITSEIADYLATRGVGTVGTDIFIDTLRYDLASVLILQTVSGSQPDEYLDTLYATITFISRDIDALTAYNRLDTVRDILHRGQNYDTPNFHIYYSHALNGIESLNRDIEDGTLYSISIRLIYRENTLIS